MAAARDSDEALYHRLRRDAELAAFDELYQHGRLPPIHIQVGTRERLLDDSRRYAALASRLSVAVQLEVFEEMHHVFQLNVEDLACARLALDLSAAFLQTCFASASRA